MAPDTTTSGNNCRKPSNNFLAEMPALADADEISAGAGVWIPAPQPKDAIESDSDEPFAKQAVASAMQLVRHPDPQVRLMGGISIMILSSKHERLAHCAIGLVFHGDEDVRAFAAGHPPLAPHMLAALATDNSIAVRAALAGRGNQESGEPSQSW